MCMTEVGSQFTPKRERQRRSNYVINLTLALYIFVPRLNYFANTVTCTYLMKCHLFMYQCQ